MFSNCADCDIQLRNAANVYCKELQFQYCKNYSALPVGVFQIVGDEAIQISTTNALTYYKLVDQTYNSH